VALDAARAGLVDEQVRERVREVAGQRDEPVVGFRVDGDRRGAERRDEAVDEPVAGRVGLGQRRQEPRCALEELGGRVLGPTRLGAANRVAADEPRRAAGGGADACLRGADVGDGGLVGGRRQRRSDLCRELRDGCGDDDQLRARDGGLERAARLVEGAASRGGIERAR
jgi:hypothetical protein